MSHHRSELNDQGRSIATQCCSVVTHIRSIVTHTRSVIWSHIIWWNWIFTFLCMWPDQSSLRLDCVKLNQDTSPQGSAASLIQPVALVISSAITLTRSGYWPGMSDYWPSWSGYWVVTDYHRVIADLIWASTEWLLSGLLTWNQWLLTIIEWLVTSQHSVMIWYPRLTWFIQTLVWVTTDHLG